MHKSKSVPTICFGKILLFYSPILGSLQESDILFSNLPDSMFNFRFRPETRTGALYSNALTRSFSKPDHGPWRVAVEASAITNTLPFSALSNRRQCGHATSCPLFNPTMPIIYLPFSSSFTIISS